ncbi:MAG: hypothetical protein IH849_08675 [Acidobacteria bacterium]|nr:hypothetical protein [Acidobacteriota bacterium]
MLAMAQSFAQGQENGLVYPVDIVADDNGWVVADFKAHGLLAVDTDGNVASIAQGPGLPRTPLYGTRAVLPAPDGDGWLVADPGTFALYRVGGDGALSTITTELDIPQGLARFDDHSVLVSDLRSGIGAVMRVTLDGVVSVFAEINSPKGIVPDGENGFVVVSHGDRALYRLGRDGSVSTLYSGAPLDFPHDLVRLPDGSFMVTDGYASAVFHVTPAGQVTSFAQGAPLVTPQGIALGADGTLLVVDPQAGAIFRIGTDAAIVRWVDVGS